MVTEAARGGACAFGGPRAGAGSAGAGEAGGRVGGRARAGVLGACLSGSSAAAPGLPRP